MFIDIYRQISTTR